MQRARQAFRRRARRHGPTKLIFIDEFGLNLGQTRRYGRAQQGQRACGHAPAKTDPNITLTIGLSLQGIVAPLAFEGATNGVTFETYVRTQLAPQLHPGDVVIADGLGSHRMRSVRQAVHDCGAHYWILPPYSPDLSPVEEAGSKIKHFIRAEGPRTTADVYEALGQALGSISSTDAAGWFGHRAAYAYPRTKPSGPPL
ncbi:transposase [Chondromyces crocatus]|nr:transposase [Chondromyces crocatus]